ncbi:MAG: riboflavin synthase [bacterium]|nr:riboflavin synthase [bacterium]
MFTGIIQSTGRIERIAKQGTGLRLTLRPDRAMPRLALGESVAVSGACLTVTSGTGRRFTVDVSPETLRRTTLGTAIRGRRVNLERALRLGDRMGGHVVQGHVDAVGRVDAITPDGDWVLYRFKAPRGVAPYLVEKGSIAIDGVSLTVFACQGGTFTVALIPHTLKATTLIDRVPGDAVNLEADILLKQIAAMLKSRLLPGTRAPVQAAPARARARSRRTPARRSAR